MDVNDTRFSALFSSHHFNIDPTDPHFRKTNAMDALISAKQKRLADADDQVIPTLLVEISLPYSHFINFKNLLCCRL